jgi:Nucleotidyl transferase AbiEii toxin, Type IV TA system
VGSTYQVQRYHVQRGDWLRVDRGIFRLTDWPASQHEDLVRWTLWSRGRAVISHETALAVHELGDVMPARVHLTVPPGFRMRASAVVVHRALLEPSDGVNLDRLRRCAVFERLLVRLEVTGPGIWVLKGGTALEVRWRERARTTKDLDLALRERPVDGAALHELLFEHLSVDPDGDGFRFDIGLPNALPEDTAGRPAWRFAARALLAGREVREGQARRGSPRRTPASVISWTCSC